MRVKRAFIIAVISAFFGTSPQLSAITMTGDMWVTDNNGSSGDSYSGQILRITPGGVSSVEVTAADITAARIVAGDTFDPTEGEGARFTDNDIVFDAFGNFSFSESISDGIFRLNQNGDLVQLLKEPEILAKTKLVDSTLSNARPENIAARSGVKLYITDAVSVANTSGLNNIHYCHHFHPSPSFPASLLSCKQVTPGGTIAILQLKPSGFFWFSNFVR